MDTSAFIAENFAITSTAFKSLLSLCRMNKAFLKLTDVTIRELEANIEAELIEANKAIDSRTAKLRILRNLERRAFSVLFEPLDEAALRADLMKLLKADFRSAKAEILAAMDVATGVIFDKYFGKKPPFGPAKKKAEFPDAFVLTALEDWCSQKKQKLYVVTKDRDMESACCDKGPLLHLDSVGAFVDLVLREENDEMDFLAQFFIDNPQPIIERITDAFEDRTIYLKDEDGSGEASVTDVILGTADVVSMSDQEVVLELDAEVSFSASVSYTDPAQTSYDSEDHELYVWGHKHADLDRYVNVTAEVTIEYEREKLIEYQVTNVTLNNGNPVKIYVDEDAKTHWK